MTSCCTQTCNQGRDCPMHPAKVARVHAHRIPREAVPLRLKKPHGMFGLRVWWLHARRAYIKWAMHDMGVLHRDYPEAVHELHAIDDELARRGA